MKAQLTLMQCVLLLTILISPTAYLVVPNFVMSLASQDAWLCILLGTLVAGAVAVWLGLFAGRNRSGHPFLDWLGARTGRTVVFAAGLAMSFHFFVTASAALNEIVNFLTVNVLPETPTPVLIGVIALVAMYAARQGIAVIARICVMVMVISLPFYAASVVLLYSKFHLANLLPIGETAPGRIAAGSLMPFGVLTEAAFILILAPFMGKPRQAPKAALWAVLLAGGELLLTVVQALALFGPNLVKSLQYPSFELIAIIELKGFLERVDMFFNMTWMLTAFLKVSLLLFGTLHCLERAIRVKESKLPVLWALGLLLTLDASVSWRQNFELRPTTFLGVTAIIGFNILIPLALWLLSLRPARSGNRWEEERT